MSDDIPAFANGAIGEINQTNPGVVIGLGSEPASNPICPPIIISPLRA